MPKGLGLAVLYLIGMECSFFKITAFTFKFVVPLLETVKYVWNIDDWVATLKMS